MEILKNITEFDTISFYSYATIPWVLFAIFWGYGAIKEKDKEYWTTAGICFLIGITPFNFILLALIGGFVVVGCIIALISFIGDSVFEYLTSK